jgi:hypothetical protein
MPPRRDHTQPRTEARLDTEGLTCREGLVLDLSGGGMRLSLAWADAPRVGDVGTYTFGEGENEVGLMGAVRWVRPAGRMRRRAEVGVEFIGLTPARREALRRFAVTGEPASLATPDNDRVRVGFPDLYKLFGVSPYASQDDLRRAYHTLSKDLHPDRCPDAEAGARFAELSKAYAILRDKGLRAKYDERLAAEQQRVA